MGIFWRYVVALSLAALLGGCASVVDVGMPEKKERTAIAAGEAALVLLRATSAVDGRPEHADLRFHAWPFGGPREWTAKREGGWWEWTKNKAASPTSREEGWRYAILSPGTYWLHFRGPVSWHSADGLNRRPSFWLNVPRGQPLVYAGSVHFVCSTDWAGLLEACSGDVPVADESEAAGTVARTFFADYGPLTTSLMYRYGQPIDDQVLEDLKPLALTTIGEQHLVTPHWWARSANRFLAMGPLGGPYDLLLYLFYLPLGTALTAADAESAKAQWDPCVRQLAEEVGQIEPLVMFRQRLKERLAHRGIDHAEEGTQNDAVALTSKGFKGLLRADLQRVELRECEKRGTFCLEVAARLTLLDLTTNEASYDSVLVYSSPLRRVGQSFDEDQEFVVTPFAECRELAAYCGEQGRQLFREELIRALDALVHKVLPAVAPRAS